MDILTETPGPTDLYDARRDARLTLEDASRHSGKSIQTLRRQESGISRVDLTLYRLYLQRAGWLIDPAWAHWSFAQGKLWTPEDVAYDEPGKIRLRDSTC